MNKLKSLTRKRFSQIISLIFADLIFFGSTNETKVSSYLIIVGFLLLVINLYIGIYVLLNVTKLYGLTIKRKKRAASYIGLAFSVIFALQSIGELSARDVIVLLPLIVVGYIYTGYFKIDSQQIS